MNIVVPMAGRGSRFSDTSYQIPKPLIPVQGEPMVFHALKSIVTLSYNQLLFIVLEEHDREFRFSEQVAKRYGSFAQVISIPDVTEGQLCTIMAAKDFINNEEDVLVTCSDTYVVSNISKDIANKKPECQGIISVANLPGDRWSFARTGSDGNVIEVAEKVRISDFASTGLYYFSSGISLVEMGESMIRKGEKTRGEYYVIPVYQKLIERGERIDISIASEVWDMGTPEALATYEQRLQNN